MDELLGGFPHVDLREFRTAQRNEEEARYIYLTSEEFINDYLSPAAWAGCKTHADENCLCDVEISKTSGITWGRCPPELVHVETVEDLLVAAANIWLNFDVVPGDIVYDQEFLLNDPNFAQALPLVRSGVSHREVNRTVPSLHKNAYKLLRRLCGFPAHWAGKQVRSNRKLPYERIYAMHAGGMTSGEIHRTFLAEGLQCSLSRISNILRENRARNADERAAKVQSNAHP